MKKGTGAELSVSDYGRDGAESEMEPEKDEEVQPG
jgi:hypothetical protein